MRLKDLPRSHNLLEIQPRLETEDIASYQWFYLTKRNCASKPAGLRHAEAKQLARSPSQPLRVLLGTTHGSCWPRTTEAPFCRRLTTPTFCMWASCPATPLHGLIVMYEKVSPSSWPLRTNLKCDTFAMFLLRISLKVWTLFDQMTWTAQKLWQPAGNFFSTVISIYPDQKKKRKKENGECNIVFL